MTSVTAAMESARSKHSMQLCQAWEVDSQPPQSDQPLYTNGQERILQIIALTCSSLSVVSAALSFYWFRRMRRSFRHDLIMVLIQSDMFKALWFMLYPVVVFISGPPLASSVWCQANGFFIALGTEASDIAVLMIAIHTSLCVFRSSPTSGDGGLYPFRHYALVFGLLFPILMASLAFANGAAAYVPATIDCYLPVEPIWYQLALSWVPRYAIFVVIFIDYIMVYVYVRYTFQTFRRESLGTESMSSTTSKRKPRLRREPPPTPPLQYNGLIPSSNGGSVVGSIVQEDDHQQINAPTGNEVRPTLKRSGISCWDWTTSRAQHRHYGSDVNDLSTGLIVPQNALSETSINSSRFGRSVHSRSLRSLSVDDWSTKLSSDRISRYPSDGSMRRHSVMNVMSFLRHQPHHPASSSWTATTPISHLELVNSVGENLAEGEMMRSREKARRQLRFLFVYPLVYIGMWILPFVNHIMQYDREYAHAPSFVFSAVCTVCLTSQCAIDCWLFSTRERPWRHIPGLSGGFWQSFTFWRCECGCQTHAGPGKSRALMAAEARAAYRRRDEEAIVLRLEARSLAFGEGSRKVPVRERSWWDDLGSLESSAIHLTNDELIGPENELRSP